MLNTTSGPVEHPHRPGHVVNTSHSVYEEPSEVVAVVPATGYYAELKDGTRIPLLVFVVTEEGEMYGTTLTDEGGIDLSLDVGERADFVRYTNDKEEA